MYEQRGGIEAYTEAVVQTLAAATGSHKVTVLAKHDRTRTLRAGLPGAVKGTGTGSIPLRARTPAFAGLLFAKAAVDRPDLIISTHLNFSPVAAWLKQRFGIPFWLSLHGVDAWNLTHRARVHALKAADLLLPVSEYTRDRVAREQGIAPEKFRLLSNTFDPAAWQIGPKPQYLLERYNLAVDQPVILTVGRLAANEAYKGQDRILRILSEVRRRISEVRYLIVGDGDDRPRLERIATEEGVAELVTFAGRVPAEELADHYRLCDLFAMPSTGEGFGIVFLEAMACGKPVIGGNRDAAVDALRGGELGVLVDPDDVQEIANVLIAILERQKADKLKSGMLNAEMLNSEGLREQGTEGLNAEIEIPSIVFQPERLREKAIEYFGFERFKATLAALLEEQFSETLNSEGLRERADRAFKS